MRKLTCLLFYIMMGIASVSQECGNCNVPPRVTMFDFDVKVPKPNGDDTTKNLWPEWQQLFMIASATGASFKKQDGNCITLTYPPAVDTGDSQQGLIGGNWANLPTNPLISSDLSDYGDYLLTGTITSDGATCTVHAEIQTSCKREVVSSADVTFSLASLITNVSTIADQIAAQLGPLAKKLTQFEKQTRAKQPDLALHKFEGKPINIITKKSTLSQGGSTTITIELKDCDGTPLAGRDVFFGDFEFEGNTEKGTVGGKVTPSKVITDGDGKATAVFTMGAGAKEAMIVAHSIGQTVKGCPSLHLGTAPINITYTYSGHITYSFEVNDKCTENKKSHCSHNLFTTQMTEGVSYTASFYTRKYKGEASGEITSEEQEDDDPLAVPDILEMGSYGKSTGSLSDFVYTCPSVSQGKHTVQRTKTDIKGGLKNSTIHFDFPEKNGEGSIVFYLDFDVKESNSSFLTLMGSSFAMINSKHTHTFSTQDDMTKSFKLKREVTGTKVKFIVEGSRTQPRTCGSVTERIKAEIIRE